MVVLLWQDQGGSVRHAESESAARRQHGRVDFQSAQLRQATRRNRKGCPPVEFKRGVSKDRRPVEDHPFALVVHQTAEFGRARISTVIRRLRRLRRAA